MKLIYNHKFLGHYSTEEHPENPERLKFFTGEKETRIINGEKYLELAHSKQYINLVKEYCSKELMLSEETFTKKDSFETACFAVGAAIQASETKSFALTRPPGHHAGIALGHGFCLFNNIAIAAKHLLLKKKKVFIFDFDLHHGDGTQEILEKENNAFYFSIHQEGIFPGTGTESKKNYINIPVASGLRDVEFVRLLERKLMPSIEKFSPDIIGLSAGFDSYYKDLNFIQAGAGFNLTTRSFKKIKELLASYNYFAVLEGGYNPESIWDGVNAFL